MTINNYPRILRKVTKIKDFANKMGCQVHEEYYTTSSLVPDSDHGKSAYYIEILMFEEDKDKNPWWAWNMVNGSEIK